MMQLLTILDKRDNFNLANSILKEAEDFLVDKFVIMVAKLSGFSGSDPL